MVRRYAAAILGATEGYLIGNVDNCRVVNTNEGGSHSGPNSRIAY